MATRKSAAKKAVKKVNIRPLRIEMASVQNTMAHPHFHGILLKQKRNKIEAYRGNSVLLTVDAREVRSARALEEKLVDALLATGWQPSKELPPKPALSRRQMKAGFEAAAPVVVEKSKLQFDAGVNHVERLQDISQALVAIDRLERDLPTIVEILKARGRQEDISLRSVLGIVECGLYEPNVVPTSPYVSLGLRGYRMPMHNVANPNMLLQSVAERLSDISELLMQEAAAVSAPLGYVSDGRIDEASSGSDKASTEAEQANERG